MSGRSVAILIAVAGLLTFFWPLVTTEQPVAGTTHWSCFDIVVQMYNGVLPAPVCERCGVPSVRALLALPLDFAASYVLLTFMCILLSLRVPTQLILWYPLIWISVALRWRYGTRIAFQNTFFGASGHGHVRYGALLAAHVVAMGALFLACLDLRGEEPLEKPRNRIWFRVEPRESQAIDAEIVKENEAANRPHRFHD